jgi:hypothetical protein
VRKLYTRVDRLFGRCDTPRHHGLGVNDVAGVELVVLGRGRYLDIAPIQALVDPGHRG